MDALELLVAESRRQTELLTLLALAPAREQAATALTGEKERLVYDLSDGTRSSRKLETETGVPKSTVSDWWREWRRRGLAVEDAAGTRVVIPLGSLALPPLSKKPTTKGTA